MNRSSMRAQMDIRSLVRKALVAVAVMLPPPAFAASILPQGETQFFDDNGNPLSEGTVTFSIPSTTTPKTTWQDAAKAIPNTNPVELDAAGRALIYGEGSYRMIVKDVDGIEIYDALTQGSGGGSGDSFVFWGGTSGGSANAQTITAASFTGVDGEVVAFRAGLTNTAALTVDPSNFAATAVRKDLPGGPVALIGGEVRAGNVVMLVYSTTDGFFHLVNQPDPFGGQAAVGVTAAGATDVLGSVGTVVNVTGSGATITSFGTGANKYKIVTFDGANTITNNATSLITPGGAGIITQAGTVFAVISDASSNVRVVGLPANAAVTISTAGTDLLTLTTTAPSRIARFISTDAGAAVGPYLTLYRDSISPLASDIMGAIFFDGEDSVGNTQTYVDIYTAITDPTSTSEDATLHLETTVAGTLATRLTLAAGGVFGTATGGDQGAGTVNATGLFDDGAAAYVVGGTDVAIADGGTGASTAAGAYANLGPSTIASFRVNKNGSDQVLASTAQTLVTWSLEAFDNGSHFATNVWTPPAGVATMTCQLTATAGIDADDLLTVTIGKNGTGAIIDAPWTAVVASGTNSTTYSVTIIDSPTGTDTYGCYTSSSDAAYTVGGNADVTTFFGSML